MWRPVVAGSTSGDRPVDSSNGEVEGQHKSIRPAPEACADEQSLAQRDQTIEDAEQTGSDSDQTLSDTDQTTSDSDQTSSERDQLAADRDQAAADRDLAAGVDPMVHEASRDIRERTSRERDRSARARVAAADQRDSIAHARDLAAVARDQAADARDLALQQQDLAFDQLGGASAISGAEILARASAQRKRAADHRAQAAEHRAMAARDRTAAAEDREQAARERLQALADRELLARELVIAETDPLTGARTRAAGLIDLDHELDRCRRTSGLLVVAYIDVVGLKTVNDTNGHGAGDELLQRVVSLVRGHLRPYDLVIRLGGDEFLCAMSNMTLTDARQRFTSLAVDLAAAPGPGAIRTGFAEFAPDQLATELIARADSELVDNRRASKARLAPT
jgi:diguanylate cyclase (GGDEF)-like protein